MIGRIYKIEGGGKIYIGSTTQTLKKRLKNHKSKATEEARKNTPLYKHFNAVGWEVATIELLVEDEFLDKRAMLERERYEIEKHNKNTSCLNSDRPVVTIEEKRLRDRMYGIRRRTENPEHEYNRVAEWRRNNPDKYAQQVARSVEQQRLKRMVANTISLHE
jgi:predicted GIY-YIG superfamily endonuclease